MDLHVLTVAVTWDTQLWQHARALCWVFTCKSSSQKAEQEHFLRVGAVVRAAKVMFEDGLVTLGKFILTYLDISFIVGKLYGFIPILLPFLHSW